MINYRENAKWTVYVHIVPKELSGYEWDKYYVGITKQKLNKRCGYSTGIQYKKSTRFYEAIQQYGFENIEHDIVAENLTKNEAFKMEETLIAELKSNDSEYGYNMTSGRGALNYCGALKIIPYDPKDRIKEKLISEINENSLFFIKNNQADFEKYEVWKPVVGYEDFYEVSNLGRVRSLDRYVKLGGRQNSDQLVLKKGKILSEKDNGHGYKAVHLTINRITKDKYVHRLVAQAFLSNQNNFPEVNHKDENPANNCLDNLEWCTAQYNDLYGNHTKNMSKSVVMYDLNMNYIDEFESAAEAERIIGIKGISAVCNGKRHTAGGYIWRFNKDISESDMISDSFLI